MKNKAALSKPTTLAKLPKILDSGVGWGEAVTESPSRDVEYNFRTVAGVTLILEGGLGEDETQNTFISSCSTFYGDSG